MALILDKAHTGVTSVDASGNTLTTGYTNLDYIDSYGNIHDDPYMVIDEFIINKLYYVVRATINIYKDSESRTNENEPLFTEYQKMEDDEELYNKYFSIEKLETDNLWTAAYKFINDEFYPSWKSDEV